MLVQCDALIAVDKMLTGGESCVQESGELELV